MISIKNLIYIVTTLFIFNSNIIAYAKEVATPPEGGSAVMYKTLIVETVHPYEIATYKNPKVFEDWLSGNNQYNYSDPTVISILKNKSKEEKIESSLYSVKQLDGFDNYIKKSYEVVANYMDKVPGIETFQVEDLNFYTESILENYKLLIEKIYNSNIDF